MLLIEEQCYKNGVVESRVILDLYRYNDRVARINTKWSIIKKMETLARDIIGSPLPREAFDKELIRPEPTNVSRMCKFPHFWNWYMRKLGYLLQDTEVTEHLFYLKTNWDALGDLNDPAGNFVSEMFKTRLKNLDISQKHQLLDLHKNLGCSDPNNVFSSKLRKLLDFNGTESAPLNRLQ